MPVQSGAHSLHSYYRLYHRSQAPNSPFAHPVPLLENFQAAVGLSMMCYRLREANKTCLGERQERGRMGKLL